MLMNVVLPAPLVPIRPTTESCSIAALTFIAAVTAPKRLFRSRASSTTAISGRLAPAEQRPEPLGQEHDHQKQRDAQGHLPGVGRKVVRDRVDDAEDRGAEERRDHAPRAGKDSDE